MKEATQEKGRAGAMRAKRWLNATTKVQIVWDAYTSPEQVRVTLADGSNKDFDLRGTMHLGGPPKPLLVECKNYASDKGQPAHYARYLADCYFATIAEGVGKETQFMWVTWHPFSMPAWRHLCGPMAVVTPEDQAAQAETVNLVNDAVIASGRLKDGEQPDPALCSTVAQRLWMIVLSERQEQFLTLDKEMVSLVRAKMMEGEDL